MRTAMPKEVRSPPLMRIQRPTRVERGRSLTVRVVAAFALVAFGAGAPLLVSSVLAGRRLSNKYDLVEPDKTKSIRTTHIDLNCENSELGPCCAPWEYEHGDDWWVQHPDFEVSHENQTAFCFSKILDSQKANFFRRIHHAQWNVSNCSTVLQRQQINSGWAASFGRVTDALWAAVQHGQPVQVTKHWEGMQWLYATNDTNNWAFCPARDITCYLLPLSPCPQVVGKDDNVRKTGGKRGSIEWLWLKQYAGRMRQHVRKQILDVIHADFPTIKLPCTAMHARRGDSGIPRRPFRRYAAISEYLQLGEIQPGDSILILTDDLSTIQEAQEHHQQYNWIYADRPRNNGTDGGFDGHIPSNDPAYDFIVIQAELQVASQCTKFVQGSSSFADMVYDAMLASGNNVTRFVLDTTVSKEEAQENYKHTGDIKARGHVMIEKIQDAYRKDHVTNQTSAILINS